MAVITEQDIPGLEEDRKLLKEIIGFHERGMAILVIKTLAVHLKETVESNDLTGSHELLFLAADAYGDRRTLQLGVRHLASDRTFADQFV